MSGTVDRNWWSFVGPKDDGRTIGTDSWFNPAAPRDYDDLFKCSHVNDLTAIGITISASREDSIDCVRGENYRFIKCVVEGSVTLKGAILGWLLEGCSISGTVEVGQYDNYWYPGRPPTVGGVIRDCCSPETHPIRLKLWDAVEPAIVRSDVKVTRIPSFIWFPYFCARYVINRGWRFRNL